MKKRTRYALLAILVLVSITSWGLTEFTSSDIDCMGLVNAAYHLNKSTLKTVVPLCYDGAQEIGYAQAFQNVSACKTWLVAVAVKSQIHCRIMSECSPHCVNTHKANIQRLMKEFPIATKQEEILMRVLNYDITEDNEG